MKTSTARLTVDLQCVCDETTRGFAVVLRRDGTAPISCPHCNELFLVTFKGQSPLAREVAVKSGKDLAGGQDDCG